MLQGIEKRELSIRENCGLYLPEIVSFLQGANVSLIFQHLLYLYKLAHIYWNQKVYVRMVWLEVNYKGNGQYF